MAEAIVLIGGYNSIWPGYLKMARDLEDVTHAVSPPGLQVIGVPLMPWHWWQARRTKDGTQILVNDPYIRVGEMNYIEALWTPQGPQCVNVDHLRLMLPQSVVKQLGATLPVCTGDLQPTNPVKLVTGPADQSMQPRVALGSP